MMRWTNLLTILLCLALASAAQAADKLLLADVEVLYPVPAAGRNGGVAAIGHSLMERLDDAAGGPIIRLSGSKGPVQGAWWFPGHLPMTAEQALTGDSRARLVVEVQARQPVRAALSVRWRGADVNGEGQASTSEPVQIGPDKPTRIELPIPQPAAGQKLAGFIFSFDKAGDYQIRRLAVVRTSHCVVEAVPPAEPRKAGDITIRGQCVPGVEQVTLKFTPVRLFEVKLPPQTPAVEKQVAVKDSQFALTISPEQIAAGFAYQVSAAPAGRPEEASPTQRIFVYPRLTGKKSPPVTRQGADLMREGKRFGFVGVNYTRFGLGLSVNADYELVAHDILQMHRWGVRVVRVTYDIGLTQPEPGVFPDSPRYAEIMKRHKLDPRYMDQIDYFIELAGELGMHIITDWHGMPIDPYRYFLGGRPSDRNTGKPGEAIAYLAPSKTKAGGFDMDNPVHVKTLLDATHWVAGHLRGNPNVIGMEVPHNEPYSKYMAIEANWRRIVDLCAAAVAEGDPQRMTFTQGPSYAHNNLLPSVTWLPPDRVTGAGPHFYQANGPVPVRADAKSFKSPWLARDVEATLGWSFPAVMMPLSAVDYPVYNGETGLHGHDSLLAGRPKAEAARILLEAQLVQEYATGMAGHLEWTLWGNEQDFDPYVDLYRTQFLRFAPVFEAGPLERMKAEVAFVQHPEAERSANGHNYACVALAKAALDAHVSPVHYLTDDQFRYFVSAELSVGLEQVVETAEGVKYKAIVADRRYLDPRTENILKTLGVPVLWLDKASDLTGRQLADFLSSAGVTADLKTPPEIQLAEGPRHLVVYRRLASGSEKQRIFPHLKREGAFDLVDENDRRVYSGDAATLAQQGIEIELPAWRSQILRIDAK